MGFIVCSASEWKVPTTFIYGYQDWMNYQGAQEARKEMKVPCEIIRVPQVCHFYLITHKHKHTHRRLAFIYMWYCPCTVVSLRDDVIYLRCPLVFLLDCPFLVFWLSDSVEV